VISLEGEKQGQKQRLTVPAASGFMAKAWRHLICIGPTPRSGLIKVRRGTDKNEEVGGPLPSREPVLRAAYPAINELICYSI